MRILNDFKNYPKAGQKFYQWFNKAFPKRNINLFLNGELDEQLGIFLSWLEDEYNITINADNASYIIYYLPNDRNDSEFDFVEEKGVKYVNQFTNDKTFDTVFASYRLALIYIFDKIEIPF